MLLNPFNKIKFHVNFNRYTNDQEINKTSTKQQENYLMSIIPRILESPIRAANCVGKLILIKFCLKVQRSSEKSLTYLHSLQFNGFFARTIFFNICYFFCCLCRSLGRK